MNRDLSLYILARGFAWTASSLLLLSFGIWVKTLTGSNSLVGLTTAFVLAPRIIGVFAGSILDRLPRQGTLAGASFASGALLLPLLTVRSADDLWLIWAACLAYGFLGVLISASAAGALKRLAAPD